MKIKVGFLCALSIILVLAGCGNPAITSVEPASGSSTGLYEITIHGKNFAQNGNEVRVGGVSAIRVDWVDRTMLKALIQGSPVPGPADVQLCNRTYSNGATLNGGFTFDPPVDPLFDRMVGLGASLSTGIQSNSLSYFTQTVGPIVQIAKQAKAYMGMPLMIFEGVPGTTMPQDVYLGHDEEVWDPLLRKMVFVPEGELYNPAWEIRDDIPGIIQSILPTIAGNLNFPLTTLRLDPAIEVLRNFSVPSAWLTDMLLGEKIGLSVFGWIIADPFMPMTDAVLTPSPSIVGDVGNSDPSIVVSLDLYAIDAALLSPDQVNLCAFESVLLLVLLDLATSNFYTTPGMEPGYQSVPFIVRTTGERIQNPFWHHLIDPYLLIVDYETLGFPNFGDLDGNGYIDPDEVDVAAVLAADDPSDNPRGVFIGNVPDPEFAPSGEGHGNTELAAALNGIFADLATHFDNIHVVDMAGYFQEVIAEAEGELPLDVLDVDNDDVQDLYLTKFGGIFSLDYLHMTETGYALWANAFIETINETMGTEVPLANVAEVFARDPLAPRNFSDEVLDWAGVPH